MTNENVMGHVFNNRVTYQITNELTTVIFKLCYGHVINNRVIYQTTSELTTVMI